MACNCAKNRPAIIAPVVHTAKPDNVEHKVQQHKIAPTEQCIACAQKHFDEAYCLFTEYGYSNENRRLVRGNLRAIVLHTFKDWPAIAEKTRECALLVQEVKDDKALELMKELGDLIDKYFMEANPEVKERLIKLSAN